MTFWTQRPYASLLAIAAYGVAIIVCPVARAQTGACCVGTSCTLRTLSGCDSVGGDWQGAGTNCSGNPCGGATLGACCNNTTLQCTVTSPSGCTNASTFLGLGVSCLPAPGPCGPLAGACCTTTTGVCQARLAGGCTDATSMFLGAGTSCSPNPCPGACCGSRDGPCRLVSQSECAFIDGAFAGQGTVCSPSPCAPLVGACCTVQLGCQVLSSAECAQFGSSAVFVGLGTTCSPNPCVGACCGGATPACQVLTPQSCSSNSGFYVGGGSVCLPDPCAPHVGACCTVQLGCQVFSSTECAQFGSSAVFVGLGTTCSPNPCVGACCGGATPACQVLTPQSCSSNSGFYVGGGSVCLPDPCAPHVGACCTVQLGCQVFSSTECAQFGSSAVFVGLGTTCSPNPCVGACCGGATPACQVLTPQSCSSNSGFYVGGGSVCLPDPCAPHVGACCTVQLGCQVFSSTECAQFGSSAVFVGLGTTCSPCNPCVNLGPVGACCNGSACTIQTQACCAGLFRGSGSNCGTASDLPVCCPADFNHVGGVTVQDIFDFLTAFFSNAPAADFNGSGTVSVQDIFDFLAAYFAGCP